MAGETGPKGHSIDPTRGGSANITGESLRRKRKLKFQVRGSPSQWKKITGWVVATQIFFMFIPKFGEDEPILTNIFQMGWNHQPAGMSCWYLVTRL